MKLTLSFLILVFALLVNINTKAYSQTPPCFPEYQGLAYQMDDIVNCPPYNSNMPLDVFIGYLALDSLSKYSSLNDYHTFINRQSFNDTIRTMMRYIYKTVEYNPYIFLNYMYHNKDFCNPIDEYYYGLIDRVLIESPNSLLDASLIASFIIAKVSIDSIYCYMDTNAVWAKTSRLVSASIDTLLKGTPPTYDNVQFFIQPQPRIDFEYAREWFLNDGYDTIGSSFDLEKNKSYIIFFECRFVCRSDSSDYYTIFPIRCSKSKTACMFPIVNGNVIDSHNELGFGTSVNLNTFYTLLANRINAIKNYTP